MGKWASLMCLVTLAVLMTASLAFGQDPYFEENPSATAGPAQQLGPDIWPTAPNGLPAGAPGCDEQPLGKSLEDNQEASYLVLSGKVKGEQGPRGSRGSRGPTGPRGPQGPTGTSGNQTQTVLVVLPSGQIVAASGSGVPPQTTPDKSSAENGGGASALPKADATAKTAPASGAMGESSMFVPWWLIALILALMAGIILAVLARNAMRSAARREERRENNAPAIVAANRMAQQLPAVPDPQGPSSGESMGIHRDSNGMITGIERHRWPVRTEVQQLAPGQAIATINAAGQIGLHQAEFTPQPQLHLHVHGLPQPGGNAVAIATAGRREELARQREVAAKPAAAKDPTPDPKAAGAAAGKEAGEAT